MPDACVITTFSINTPATVCEPKNSLPLYMLTAAYEYMAKEKNNNKQKGKKIKEGKHNIMYIILIRLMARASAPFVSWRG